MASSVAGVLAALSLLVILVELLVRGHHLDGSTIAVFAGSLLVVVAAFAHHYETHAATAPTSAEILRQARRAQAQVLQGDQQPVSASSSAVRSAASTLSS